MKVVENVYIAICDDDSNIASKIQKVVSACYKNIDESIEISVFDNGTELIDSICKENKYYDMIHLDIDMPDKSGLEVAKILRESHDDIIIIFISSYEQYVFDSFEYSPFRYIRKNNMVEELRVALKSAYALYKKAEKKYIIVKGEDSVHKIEQSEICYCDMILRKMYIHLKDNRVICTRKTIRDFLKEMDSNNFIKIHSGGVVNIKYIKEYREQSIILDNGTKLMTSRSAIKVIKNALIRYWREIV